MLAIRLDPETEERLERLARLTGRTKTFYAREAITAHMDDLEDVYLGEHRLEDLRAGREATVPLDDVARQHGLED